MSLVAYRGPLLDVSTTQVPTGSTVRLRFDVHGNADINEGAFTVSGGRLIVPEAGIYQINVGLDIERTTIDNGAGGRNEVFIAIGRRRSNVNFEYPERSSDYTRGASTANRATVDGELLVELEANDQIYVTLQSTQQTTYQVRGASSWIAAVKQEPEGSGGGGATSFSDLTGMIADSQIPDDIARDSEIPTRLPPSTGSVTVTSLATDLVLPDSAIPDSIARDSEIPTIPDPIPGPKGDRGIQGLPGIRGLKGDKGDPGTTVVANSEESGTATLNRLTVGETVYNLPTGGDGGGTSVLALTDENGELTGLTIDGVDYDLPVRRIIQPTASLQERLENYLRTVDDYTVSDWNRPVLGSIRSGVGSDYKPVVSTRYAGSQIRGVTGGSVTRRSRAVVRVVLSRQSDSVFSEGTDIEQQESRIIQHLNRVHDAYPEIEGTLVDYDHNIGKGKYVALIITVLSS